MKRISLILIILILIVFGVSAAVADTAPLHLSTSVDPITQVIVGGHNVALPDSLSSFTGIDEIGTSGNPFVFKYDGESWEGEHYFSAFVMTNDPGSYSVTTTAEPLKTSGQNVYAMPYYVTIGTGSATKVEGSSVALTLINSFTVTEAAGMAFAKSETITLSVEADDYQAAGAGNYSSIWTINLIKN
jgi:hypothetical protein